MRDRIVMLWMRFMDILKYHKYIIDIKNLINFN